MKYLRSQNMQAGDTFDIFFVHPSGDAVSAAIAVVSKNLLPG